jgi:hypothetical protein
MIAWVLVEASCTVGEARNGALQVRWRPGAAGSGRQKADSTGKAPDQAFFCARDVRGVRSADNPPSEARVGQMATNSTGQRPVPQGES